MAERLEKWKSTETFPIILRNSFKKKKAKLIIQSTLKS